MSLSQLHKPVLLQETLQAMKSFFSSDQSFYGVDGTFGRGGHASVLMEAFSGLEILGLDQDIDAIEYAKVKYKDLIESGRLSVVHTNFSDLDEIKKSLKSPPDFVFLDIGVSSPQLDNAERGFSFYQDGELDMRMDQSKGQTAADVVNEESLERLREIFLEYGEVYAPQRLLESIEEFRNEKPFKNTQELSNLIERKCGWRKKGMHPATLYFQALRIYVNNELDHLTKALEAYVEILKPGGIILVISFHSLEDRIVKKFFKSTRYGKPINKKVIKPSESELSENKRARSAKLRVFQKNVEGVLNGK